MENQFLIKYTIDKIYYLSVGIRIMILIRCYFSKSKYFFKMLKKIFSFAIRDKKNIFSFRFELAELI